MIAADGDSFAIGERKFRLQGIDAPEYNQTCTDAAGKVWSCGKASYTSLAAMLSAPNLSCQYSLYDRFGRALVSCSNVAITDIAAQQVRSGMAVSNAFNGLRDYGKEEDEARTAKRGIWQGPFTAPKDWRAANGR